MRQPLLGVGEEFGQAIAFLEPCLEVCDDEVLVGRRLVHPREATGRMPQGSADGYDRPIPEVAFVMSPRQPHLLRELAETLGYELGLQAVPSSVHVGAFPSPRPERVYVLLDPHSYVAAEGLDALPDDTILARTVMLGVEPPPTEFTDPHVALLRRAGAVFVIDQRAVVGLGRLGIRARLVRPGYTRSHDQFDPDADRPIDVVFLGADPGAVPGARPSLITASSKS